MRRDDHGLVILDGHQFIRGESDWRVDVLVGALVGVVHAHDRPHDGFAIVGRPVPVNSTRDGVDHASGGRFTLFGAVAPVLNDLPIFVLRGVPVGFWSLLLLVLSQVAVPDELLNGIF